MPHQAPPFQFEALWEAVLDSVPHWAMVIQVSTRTVLMANAKARESGALVGSRCWDSFGRRLFIDQEMRQRVKNCGIDRTGPEVHCKFCRAEKAFAQGASVHKEIARDGLVWDTWWVPVAPDVYLHYAVDVTEKRQAERLRLNSAQLDSAVATAGAVCHELNQPLQTAAWLVEMLKERLASDPKALADLDKVEESLGRMAQFTAKLKSIIRYEIKEYLPGINILDLDQSVHPDRSEKEEP